MRPRSPFYYRWKGKFLHSGIHILSHLRLLFRWILFSVLTGSLVGLVGTAFVYSIQWVSVWRTGHTWLLLLLPIGGISIVWMYRVARDTNDRGTNMVLASLRAEAELPFQMAPLIFLATVITHLCGGSAGREGAALQLGGSIGSTLSRLFRLNERDKHVLMLCGMSAAFSAIFRTPIAAAIFAMEVVCVGIMHYAALVPCTIASLTASWIASRCGIPITAYTISDIPALELVPAAKILLLGILCAAVSILFCILLHQTEKWFTRYISNPYLRILLSSCILLLFFLLIRNQEYFGLGSDTIRAALSGTVIWYAFLAKMFTTAVTIAGGFKGGEIVPSFFIGASFGCLFGQIFGISPSFCAAIGMTALFCGVTNCPLAALMIAVELFGAEGLPYYLLAVSISYLLSGYYGLYGEQTFHMSKFTGGAISHKTRK